MKTLNMSKYVSAIRNSEFTMDRYQPLDLHPKQMTQQQIFLLRRAWALFNRGPDTFHNATYAFLRLFVLAPESNFVVESNDISSKELLKNVVTNDHISYVINFITDAIDNIEDRGALEKMAVDLGKRHFTHGARIDFTKAVAEGFLFAMEKTLWPEVDADVLEAWENLLVFIVHFWAVGFTEQMTDYHKTCSYSKYRVPRRIRLLDDIDGAKAAASDSAVDQQQIEMHAAEGTEIIQRSTELS